MAKRAPDDLAATDKRPRPAGTDPAGAHPALQQVHTNCYAQAYVEALRRPGAVADAGPAHDLGPLLAAAQRMCR